MKIDKKTKEETVLLTEWDFPTQDGLFDVHLETGFPIILQNGMIYVPYWAAVSQGTDIPYKVWRFPDEYAGRKKLFQSLDVELMQAKQRACGISASTGMTTITP